MLLVIVLKGCHRGLWNVQQSDITVSRPFMAVQTTRGATPCVNGPLLMVPWDRFPRPLNEGLRNKPRLVKLPGPVTSRYCWPVCSFPTFLLGHQKRLILVLHFSRPLSSESESDSFRVSLGKRKCCLPALRRRQQLRPSQKSRTTLKVILGTAAGLKRKTEGGPTPPQSKKKLECGPMPNVMVALPNIGGALCSMPQSLADSGMPCSNTAKTWNPLKFAGVPQTTGSISDASAPKFAILWGHVEVILLLNKFFPIVGTCLSCEDIARQICAMVPRWRFLATFLCPVISASHVQHVSDLHLKFTLRPHHVCKYGRHTLCDGWD